jgi:hypothetical protein
MAVERIKLHFLSLILPGSWYYQSILFDCLSLLTFPHWITMATTLILFVLLPYGTTEIALLKQLENYEHPNIVR